MENIRKDLGDMPCEFQELVSSMTPGDEVILMSDGVPVAKVVLVPKVQRKLGMLKGTVLGMTSDFDETPDEFRDYL